MTGSVICKHLHSFPIAFPLLSKRCVLHRSFEFADSHLNPVRYIGMDVHQATIPVAVMDSGGKLIVGSILETRVSTLYFPLDRLKTECYIL